MTSTGKWLSSVFKDSFNLCGWLYYKKTLLLKNPSEVTTSAQMKRKRRHATIVFKSNESVMCWITEQDDIQLIRQPLSVAKGPALQQDERPLKLHIPSYFSHSIIFKYVQLTVNDQWLYLRTWAHLLCLHLGTFHF